MSGNNDLQSIDREGIGKKTSATKLLNWYTKSTASDPLNLSIYIENE